MTTITISQDIDTPARREITPNAVLTYLYDRSRDSKNSKAPGQDFIGYAYDDTRLAFAVCDGVSQSFFGEIAAQYLGERLVGWLLEQETGDAVAANIEQALKDWVRGGNLLVVSKTVSPKLPPMVREALERKRDIGSETMFVAGLIDFSANRLWSVWMGDMRLWLWDQHGASVAIPDAVWDTKERWSTKVGPKNGGVRSASISLEGITHITAHSDGLGSRTDNLKAISVNSLNKLAADLADAAASDDVSILDIQPGHAEATEPLPAPALEQISLDAPTLIWSEVPGATSYRLMIEARLKRWTVEVTDTSYFLEPETAEGAICQVQALAGEVPGKWSDPLPVQYEPPIPYETKTMTARQLRNVIPLARESFGQPRQFRLMPIIILSLLLALLLSIGFIVLTFPR
jgi:hypothetical protein